MKTLALVFYFLVAFTNPDYTSVHGVITDAQTNEPLPGVHIFYPEKNTGMVSDVDGNFQLLIEHETEIIFSHIGYQRIRMKVSAETSRHLEVLLEPSEIQSDYTINISSQKYHHTNTHGNIQTRTSEEYLKTLNGVDMVNRANFAREPVLRGMQGNRVDILIDGMRLTPACVDRMDPQTAYIETENLESITVQHGNGSQTGTPGGVVNFQMSKASLNSGTQSGFESSYQSASEQKYVQAFVSHGEENWALRVSGTYRNAGDFRVGNGLQLENSGFKKGNIHSSLIFKPTKQQEWSLRYIGDFAADIGYPALIMDTRKAHAHIGGLDFSQTFTDRFFYDVNASMYFNQVDHYMDDYDRDVSARNVMRNMYMPMYGQTQTFGFGTDTRAFLGQNILNINAESYMRKAFGDMLMEHLNPDVADMYLINMGDAEQWNSALGVSYDVFINDNWELRLNSRFETVLNQLNHPTARATYFAQYPELEKVDSFLSAYQAGLQLRHFPNSSSMLSLKISDGTRLPGHLELYGYYIYQPLDDYFYIGNPALKPERSTQAELSYQAVFADGLFKPGFTVWANYMDDYITGMMTDHIFKYYENTGRARLFGFEGALDMKFSEMILLENRLSYTNGYHLDIKEPLPMIPPFKGLHNLKVKSNTVILNLGLRWSSAQNRIAEVSTLESKTKSWTIFDISADIRLSDKAGLKIGVDNLFDTWYTDHLSVNNMPESGRNIFMTLRMRF